VKKGAFDDCRLRSRRRQARRAKPIKKVEKVEQQIRDLVIARRWPVGQSLGSEAELGARFGVGRSVLREAIRSLEQLGVVERGRGGRSGPRVITPDPATVIETRRRRLRHERPDSGQIQRLGAAIEMREPLGNGLIRNLF